MRRYFSSELYIVIQVSVCLYAEHNILRCDIERDTFSRRQVRAGCGKKSLKRLTYMLHSFKTSLQYCSQLPLFISHRLTRGFRITASSLRSFCNPQICPNTNMFSVSKLNAIYNIQQGPINPPTYKKLLRLTPKMKLLVLRRHSCRVHNKLLPRYL